MTCQIEFSPDFSKQLVKLKKKDRVMHERVSKKLEEIAENPEHYKPLRGDLSGKRSVHFDPFVLVFRLEEDIVYVLYIKHHDEAY